MHKLTKSKKKYQPVAIAMLLPLLILFIVVIVIPIIDLVRTSFFEWSGIKGASYKFVGFQNYIDFFKSREASVVYKNNLILVAVGVFITMPISFFLATVVNKVFKGVRFFKTGYFLPVIINRVATCLMFTLLFFPKMGMVPMVANFLGLQGFSNILGDPHKAIYGVAFVNMWCFAGFYMVVFSAGLAAIPDEIYEAAELDGVNSRTRLLHITLPMLKPTISVVLVFVVTGAFKVFEIVQALTGAGPGGATEVFNTLLYKTAFTYNQYGMSDAIAIVMLITCILLSTGLNKLLEKVN